MFLLKQPRLIALASTVVLMTGNVTGMLAVRAQEPDSPATSDARTTGDKYSALTEAIRLLEAGETAVAAKTLKAIVPTELSADERMRWTNAARVAAIRTGDSAWLKAINDAFGAAEEQPYEEAGTYLIQAARGYLAAGDFARTAEFLELFKRDFVRFGERDRRRWLAVSARLAQLTGDTATERKYITQLVEYPGMWPMPSCQKCHANPSVPKTMPLLDVRNWWPGERYAALLKQSGEAETTRERLRERLRKYPNDNAARMQLVYTLKALGKQAEADDVLRYFPWAKFPERTGVEPVGIGVYP
jgi:hypothetical protein